MFIIAERISKGGLGISLKFCLEEQKYYGYVDGYWKRLETTPLDKMILDVYDGKMINEKTHEINCRKYAVTTRKQILENLKPLVYEHLEVFNKTGFLNFDMGEFDPVEKKLHPHLMSNYSTLRMPYEFNFKLDGKNLVWNDECSLWLKTLGEIFENDLEKINLLQEFFGYCLTRDVRHEKALLLLGESRTGKSTILETMSSVIGEHNFSSVPLEHIENPQYTPLLMNKLINFDTDVSGQAEKYESSFRKITSGEKINCNPKYVAPYTFRPYCKMIMAANQFPRIKDPSSAFYKRLLVLPCDRVFEDSEQDVRLKDKLHSELFGIFMWAVEGLKRLNDRGGFEKKIFMNEAVDELRLESNPTELFFKEHIKAKLDKNIITKTVLYEKYKDWSIRVNQQYALSAIRFSQAVYRKYSKFTPKDSKNQQGERVWRNITYVIDDSPTTDNKIEEENLNWQE